VETALWAVAGVVGAGIGALCAVEVIHQTVRRLGRRSVLLAELAKHAHRPFQVFLTLLAMQLALRSLVQSFPWRDEVLHIILLAVIGTGAWLVGVLLLVIEDVALARFGTDVPDNRRRRRLHTQIVMVRRVTVAIVVIIAAGVTLMTFPQVRAIGASVLASAGIMGIVAGLAAQSMLANVIAGLQLAFSDAIRLDDVVVVEGEWGKIEEITLSHVVVQIWDDRRLIMPTSYFTTTPFQNWTRTSAAVIGTVELEVDWTVPVPAMRDELRALLESTDMWDGRVCVLQVTEAQGGLVKLRALVSAADAPTLWDLRCLTREHLVAWVRDHRPTALPRWRAEVADGGQHQEWHWARALRTAPATAGESSPDARAFSGDAVAAARGHAFVGPMPRDNSRP
jgi:hypothetical protein